MKDAKIEVLDRLLGVARLIRRKGAPAEAREALHYEELLERDLKARQEELNQQGELLLAGAHHDKAA